MMTKKVKRLTDLGKRKDMVNIDPKDIVIRKGFNYRDIDTPEARAHIAFLAEDIARQGIKHPIEVEFIDGKPHVVDGECRVRAALIAHKTNPEIKVPCIQVDTHDEAALIARAITANGSLVPSPEEFGNAAQRLKDLGWTDEKIAELVPPHIKVKGLKQAKRFVTDARELSNAPVAIKKAVREGIEGVKVSPAAAVSAVRKHGTKAAEKLTVAAKKAKENGKVAVTREKADGTLLTTGDLLADAILDSAEWNVAAIMEIARQWRAVRKPAKAA